jgi:hypothetical protein
MVRILEVRPEAGVEGSWREFGEWRKGPPAVEFVGGLWRFVEEVGGPDQVLLALVVCFVRRFLDFL